MANTDIRMIIMACIGIIIFILMSTAIVLIIKRRTRNPFDEMDGEAFEDYCARLLYLKGFEDIELTQASHDYGIDIFAEKDGVTYAIQCKCYSETVGIKAVQEVYSGKDYYDKMVAVVMTNNYFSAPAVKFAEKLKVILWDGDFIYKNSLEI